MNYRQQKVEKEERLKELKNSAPSDDIFEQLPDKFERPPKSRSTKLPTLTQYTEEAISDVRFLIDFFERFL